MQQLVNQFIEKVSAWEESQIGQTSGFEWERSFDQMWTELGREVLQASLNSSPQPSRDKKTIRTKYGIVAAPRSHAFFHVGGGFRVSSYLQYLGCYLGQQEIFDEASRSLEMLTGQQLDPKQIERMCHHYGAELEAELQAKIQSGETLSYSEKQVDSVFYAMLDGANFMTRESGWKEVKLGRIFQAAQHFELSEQRNWIRDSIYVAHYGDYRTFLEKFEYCIHSLKQLVIIADGAPWIWEWAEANFPDQIQILDFFHAMEHLCKFAKLFFKEEEIRKTWIEEQKEALLNDKVGEVIAELKNLPKTRSQAKEDEKQRLIRYYEKNKKRMMYKSFREKGLMIGSGPIESAHRSVLQKRLKLSGQRWSNRGLQAMANLRTLDKSGKWKEMIRLTQKMAA